MTALRGFGKIKIAPYDASVPFGSRKFRDIGNNSTFNLTATEQEETLPDYRDASGGTDASYRRVESAAGSIDARHVTGENLALATWGTSEALPTAAITDEPHVLHAGAFVPAERVIDLTETTVVKKGTTDVAPADYVVSAGGITFNSEITTADVADGDPITFSYQAADSVDVQALIETAPNVSIFFEGVNAVNGKPLVVRIWKAKLGIAQTIALIGTEFATLGLNYTIEKDETIAGNEVSKYYKVAVG